LLLGQDVGWVPAEPAKLIGNWLALPGKLFLGLIGLVLVPLIFVSIIQGLNGSSNVGELRNIGIRLAVFVILTTTLAAAIGIFMALFIEPGSYMEISGLSGKAAPAAPAAESAGTESIKGRVPELIAGLIPTSFLQAAMNRDMLAIVLVAILLGIACATADQEKVRPFLRVLDAVLEVAMTVVKWAMFLAPWAVFGLMAQLVSSVGFDTVLGMGAYVLAVLLGLLGLLLVYLLLAAAFGGVGPISFLTRTGSVQLLAFSTSSSAAVMPLTIETAVVKLGVPDNVAGLVVPLGATINMAGTALYQAVAVIFLAQMSGVTLSLPELALIVMTLVVSSIGAPGTPGVSIVILSNIVGGFGIPTAGLVLILGVDRILDMCRTTVNVMGDLTACTLLRSVGSAKGADRPETSSA
jgi:Na+/H+-dicarboxylate symporter